MKPEDIRPDTVIALLSTPASRCDLRSALDAEQGSGLPLHWAFSAAATKALVTGQQLECVARALIADGADELLDDLVFHPQMPLQVLLDLCEAGRCVSALGHRAGPRALLERVAEKHGYEEAILTVALDLYRDPAVDAKEFAQFAKRHRELEWMLRALAHAVPSSRDKEAVYRDLLPGYEEPRARASCEGPWSDLLSSCSRRSPLPSR